MSSLLPLVVFHRLLPVLSPCNLLCRLFCFISCCLFCLRVLSSAACFVSYPAAFSVSVSFLLPILYLILLPVCLHVFSSSACSVSHSIALLSTVQSPYLQLFNFLLPTPAVFFQRTKMKTSGVKDRGVDPLQGLRGLAAVHVMLAHFYQPFIG